MATVEQLQARLTEAEDAFHKLMLGKQARVFVDQNGERIEYTMTNRASLASYIQELKRQLGQTNAGPLNFWIGP